MPTLYCGYVVKLYIDRYCITANCTCPTYPIVCVHVQLCVLCFALYRFGNPTNVEKCYSVFAAYYVKTFNGERPLLLLH